MANKINSWLISGVTVFLALGGNGSFAVSSSCPDPSAYPLNGCSLPGTTGGGFPYFDQTVAVTYKGKDSENAVFKIRGKSLQDSQRRSLLPDDATTVAIPGMKIELAVKVDGAVASGDLENFFGARRQCFLGNCIERAGDELINSGDALRITGKIPGLGKFSLSADLKGGWDASEDGMLWGFDTTHIACSGALASLIDCAPDGVMYLNLLEAIGPDTGANKIRTAGLALTSVAVPVPAAAWLFSSGLLGLGAVSRYQGTLHRG